MNRPAEPVELDCRGKVCPLPVIELGRAVDAVEPGQEVALLTDDPAAAVDVAAFCRMRDHALVASQPLDAGVTRYVVRKGPSQAEASATAASP
jgi:tRNA 2-thiouridine synthesizing protein A